MIAGTRAVRARPLSRGDCLPARWPLRPRAPRRAFSRLELTPAAVGAHRVRFHPFPPMTAPLPRRCSTVGAECSRSDGSVRDCRGGRVGDRQGRMGPPGRMRRAAGSHRARIGPAPCLKRSLSASLRLQCRVLFQLLAETRIGVRRATIRDDPARLETTWQYSISGPFRGQSA